MEPNVSEDGTKVYFSYFHDTTFESSFSFGLNRLPLKGADLYVVDLGALLTNNHEDPANLPVQRLTFREYDAQGKQTDEDKYKDAMNQTLANNTAPNDWGTVYMHATEMRTAGGLKLVYASDERRVKNSNQEMAIGHANHNFNLHIADLAPDGGLTNPRQFHYYTTTSVLSPSPLRNGIAFSYQSSTAAARELAHSRFEFRWTVVSHHRIWHQPRTVPLRRVLCEDQRVESRRLFRRNQVLQCEQ